MEESKERVERIKTKERKPKYRWVLGPGGRFLVESLVRDRPDWVPVEVPPEHKVTVSGTAIRGVKGGGKVGHGRIGKIEPGSFFSGETFVSPLAKVRVPFEKKS